MFMHYIDSYYPYDYHIFSLKILNFDLIKTIFNFKQFMILHNFM